MTKDTGRRQGSLARLISTALLARLLALFAGVVGLAGMPMDWPTVLGIATLGGISLWGMLLGSRTNLALILTRHPSLVVLDAAVNLGVLALVGFDSPLALATTTTALLIGLLLPFTVRLPAIAILVAGYLLVGLASDLDLAHGNVTLLVGIPGLCVMLAAIGASMRGLLDEAETLSEEVGTIHLAEATRTERERLAREMHDSVAKSMHGVGLLAAALPMWIDKDVESAKRQARVICEAADEAARQSRTLLNRLRADQPDRSLGDVVAGTARDWAARHAVDLDLDISGAVDVFEQDRYELIAGYSEALENVARHAHATKVRVMLTGTASHVTITVADNGRGMGPDTLTEALARGRYGIVGIRERLASVGGMADVTSAPGEGTTVTLLYPLRRDTHV